MATNDDATKVMPGAQPVGPRVTNKELEHRYTYHAPSGEARERHERIRTEFRWFSQFLNDVLPEGRSKSLAHTALEEASFHAHASIAREPALHDEPVQG